VDVRNVFWFDGGALTGKVPVGPGAFSWRSSVDGAHPIRVIDDHGRAAARQAGLPHCSNGRFFDNLTAPSSVDPLFAHKDDLLK
jgi:hypothetical protein